MGPADACDREGPAEPGDGDDVSAGRFRPSPHGPGTVGLPVGDEDRRGAGSAPDADKMGALSAGSFPAFPGPGAISSSPMPSPWKPIPIGSSGTPRWGPRRAPSPPARSS